MKRSVALLASLSVALVGAAAQAEEGRFDAQIFRPAAAPRDLVMVQKSEVIADRSPTVGVLVHYSLDPLALFMKERDQQLKAVAARFELDALAGIGLFDWADVTLAFPIILAQTGDNLRPIGSEGAVASSVLGDLRLSARVALPYLNRKAEIKRGFGMALTGNIGLPTGNQNAFAGDGAVTGGVGLIADYRWNFGLIIAANGGFWFRPDREFAGVRVGDMGSFGLAAEMNIIQRWGISVIGEVYGHVSLTKFPDSPRQVPAEALLGVRWQSKHGITLTVGGAFGADCGFGVPAFRAFTELTWQPSKSYEQEEINRLQQRDIDDPDGDGLMDKIDRCPQEPGLPANFGCPDADKDKDGIVDRDDECPEENSGSAGQKGCPMARVQGDQIVILDQVHFATDKDVILDDSKPTLQSVAQVLKEHPEIRLLEIEGHTDIRAGDSYNIRLSQRRVDSVKAYLVEQGVDPLRIHATGYGHSQPIYDDSHCNMPDDQLTPECKRHTSANRRVVFNIKHRGAPPPKSITGADSNVGILPGRETTLPSTSRLPTGGQLPKEGVLQKGSTLPGSGTVLPKGPDAMDPDAAKRNGAPPPIREGSGGVLPRTGEGAAPGAGALPDGTSNILPKAGTPAPKKPAAPPAPPPK
uniref:TraB n=1 Tax=Byssovorax cruenta TaxID=293647 RepID=A0A410RAF1_9BACT|nr:TraB [Byssovorax cruenta]